MIESAERETELTRNEQLIKFLVEACSGEIGRTQLAKLLYLADYQAYRYLGESISEFSWTRDPYGPFDDSIYGVKDSLETRGFIEEKKGLTPFGNPSYSFVDTGQPVDYDFSPGEQRILRYIVDAYARMSRQQLVEDVVYETPPFKEVEDQPGAPVPLEEVANERKEALFGLSLNEIEQGRKRLRSGLGIPLNEVVDELRGGGRSGGSDEAGRERPAARGG